MEGVTTDHKELRDAGNGHPIACVPQFIMVSGDTLHSSCPLQVSVEVTQRNFPLLPFACPWRGSDTEGSPNAAFSFQKHFDVGHH